MKMKNQRVEHTGILEWSSLLRLDGLTEIIYLYLLKINGYRINYIVTKNMQSLKKSMFIIIIVVYYFVTQLCLAFILFLASPKFFI